MDGLEEELDALERILCGQKEPDSLDFRLLRQLTGDFSDYRRIGEGGCAEVYKGLLPNGKVIAVKKIKKDHIIDDKMFRREVDSMIKVQHQNIVRFLGYCSEIKEKAVLMDDGNFVMAEEREKLLCFPYISKGSLDKHLTDELRGFEWHTRYQIIKGICDGLLYLHKEKGIMHMDLKPANILLGDEMVPKITDFGVSRIDGKTQITSAERLFSRGHAAPEYIDSGVRSWKSDIYSLGVIIVELVTGTRKIPNTTKVLRRWRHRWNKSSKHTPLSYLQVKKCLELAVSCQEINPVNRPFIWDVVRELNELDRWDGQITESSLEKIISSSDDMLGIEPLELYLPLGHEKQVSCSTELRNDTDYYMAFRIATTSLLPFSIQPDKGIAAPGSMCQITIVLPEQEMARLKNHRERFIVQSTRVDGSLTAADITGDTFNDKGGYSQKKNDHGDKVVDEVTLMVLFDILHEDNQDQANLSAHMGSLGTSSKEVQKSMELSPHQDYEDPMYVPPNGVMDQSSDHFNPQGIAAPAASTSRQMPANYYPWSSLDWRTSNRQPWDRPMFFSDSRGTLSKMKVTKLRVPVDYPDAKDYKFGFDLRQIDDLLPEEDEYFAGITDETEPAGQTNTTEELEFDVFSNGGGMELDIDPVENIQVSFANSSIVDGARGNDINAFGVPSTVGTVAGEHPFEEHHTRTILVRNINSNVEDSELQSLFEQYGDIRTLYTATKERDFVIISYFDIKAAGNAMRALQNKPLRSRKLDIGFLPMGNELNQGTLSISILDPSVTDEEVRQIFGAYGEIKEITETPNKKHHKFIEFYDVRAAVAALRSLNKSEIAGKRIKLKPSCTSHVKEDADDGGHGQDSKRSTRTRKANSRILGSNWVAK